MATRELSEGGALHPVSALGEGGEGGIFPDKD